MKHILIAAISMLFTQVGISQFIACKWSWAETSQVSTKSGLKLRTEQSTDSRVIAVIPFQDEVKACYEYTKLDTINGLSGRWVKTYWKEKKGYVFDGYLKKIEDNPTISSNNHGVVGHDIEKGAANVLGNISHSDDQNYFGLFRTVNDREFNLRKIQWSEEQIRNLPTPSINKETPIWIFRNIGQTSGKTVKGQLLNRMLFIGEKVDTNHGTIYVDGTLQKEDSLRIEGFRIDPYELRFQSRGGHELHDELLLRMNCWGGISKSIGYEAQVVVNFVGDLDGDARDDILITFQTTYKGWYYALYSTRYAVEGKQFKELIIGGGSE